MTRLLKFTLALCAACICCASVLAQNYPVRPVRLLVGSAPGGGADFIARALSPKLTESLGQSVVIENRPGANGAIAAEVVARSAPDGHTLLLNVIGHTINPSLMKLKFDAINDFAFISQIAESQNLLVAHPSKGGAPAMVDLLAGQISISFGNIPTVIQQVRTGKLRAIAVTGAKRSAAAPDIPTVGESGVPGFEVSNWFGMSAPGKTPAAIVDRIYSDIARALKSPELRTALSNGGADPVGSTPAQYTAFVQSEYAKWAKVIKAAGIKGE